MRYNDYDSDASEQHSEDSDVSSSGPVRRGRSSQKGKSRTSKVRTLNRWTTEEHDKLAYLVDKWGSEKNWAKVAEEMPGRTGKQCRERWLNHMKPGIIKGNWSQEEEFLLAQCHALVGSHWSKMTKRLPGRTENSIKNFWNATLRSKAPNKKRGMLWTYMQLHDAKSDDNTAALITAITRLHDSRELPPHLLGQLDTELLDSRTWKAILKAEKDFLENVGGELHCLALPHPNAALASMDACAALIGDHEQQAFAMAAAVGPADQHDRLELAGVGGPFLCQHSSDGRSSSQSYVPAQHMVHGLMLDAARPKDVVMPHGCGQADTSAEADRRCAASAACHAGFAGNEPEQHYPLSLLAPDLHAYQHQQSQVHHQPPCTAVEAEQPVFGRGWGSSTMYREASNELKHTPHTSYASGSKSSGHTRAPQPRRCSRVAGDAESAASLEHPYTSQPGLSPPAVKQEYKPAGTSGPQLAAHCDQNDSGPGSTAELRQHSRSSPKLPDTRADHSRLDNSAAAGSRRRLAGSGAGCGVTGGHGPNCSCGPCVNSRKLHGLHSPGARRQNKNANSGAQGSSSSTRLRGPNNLAASSELSGLPPAKVQRTQWMRPQANGGGVASQRCISMYNSYPAQPADRASDTCPQAVGPAAPSELATYCAGHSMGGLAQDSLDMVSGAVSHVQPGPMLQHHGSEASYSQQAAVGWGGAGVLAAEPPITAGVRPHVLAPEQDVLPHMPAAEAEAAETFEGLPWLDRLAVQQQQQQQPQQQQPQQQPHQQQQQVVSVLEPAATHRPQLQQSLAISTDMPQSRDPAFMPALPSVQAVFGPGGSSAGGSSGQLSARRPRQQGLDLSLALASPIAIRLGISAGALEGLGPVDQLHRVSVGQDLGFYVPHSCRQGVRLPSFGQIIMQRASASTLDWDWEALLQADTTARTARGPEAGEAAAPHRGAAGLTLAGVKRARVSMTSLDDDAALLIDRVAQGSDSQDLYCGIPWVSGD